MLGGRRRVARLLSAKPKKHRRERTRQGTNDQGRMWWRVLGWLQGSGQCVCVWRGQCVSPTPRRKQHTKGRAGEGETTGGRSCCRGGRQRQQTFTNFKPDHEARAERPRKCWSVVWWARHDLIRQPKTMLGMSQGFSGALRGVPDARIERPRCEPATACVPLQSVRLLFSFCAFFSAYAPMFVLLFIVETHTSCHFY